MSKISYVEGEIFRVENPENVTGLYFPIANEAGIKSSVTPNGGGDAKYDQNSFLLEPVSEANLHNNRGVRNFWVHIKGEGAWSAMGASAEEEAKRFTDRQDESALEAGFMCQCVTRRSETYGLSVKVTSFVPVDVDVELMQVELTNESDKAREITPYVAIPLYGRSADNLRDHRHVTAMLHRMRASEYGVMVKPTLSFDERGHKKNELTYYACAVGGDGEKPESFFLVQDEFIGEGGTLTRPYAVIANEVGVPAGSTAEGKEAMGGMRFAPRMLGAHESICFTVIMGITKNAEIIEENVKAFDSSEKVEDARKKLAKYWKEKVNVTVKTGDAGMDCLMRWVSFQPFLRRIYGCSFLPHHDYGRGGRGWRDLWQDCLSLLIMDPKDVRDMICANYGGVRVDGTNATIIGTNKGEFIADRNGIPRVWMDHGLWPFITTSLYLNQTGDTDVLWEKAPYFKDKLCMRGTDIDTVWNVDAGVCQKTVDGRIYEGTLLEHILLENLCAFYEVGEHNHMRLRGADWNDAIDMASERGESVAFTAAYAGNLMNLAKLLRTLAAKGVKEIALLSEMGVLLQGEEMLYESSKSKKSVLEKYTESCRHVVSGRTTNFDTLQVAADLSGKAAWIQEHIRKTEWIQGEKEGWFNSYYDNHGNAVEGYREDGVRMMLTGQVFSIMSGTAKDEQIPTICASADRYLYRKEIGGYRLNTNFHEEKYDMGRMFGFAYGEKENGAVFSHMTVMYANALYQRGYAKEGYKALNTLASQAIDFEHSRIYPGIPEYFDAKGRGLYHYLTGAASWYLLTYVTEVFGVKGCLGDLTICPKLVREQFNESQMAAIALTYGGKSFVIKMENASLKDYGEYRILRAECDGSALKITDGVAGELKDGVTSGLRNGMAVLTKEAVAALSEGCHEIKIVLG